MQETQHGAQAKVDRHAQLKSGRPGDHLPPGVDGYALVFDSATGLWTPEALPGSGVAASKADPTGFGLPWTADPRTLSALQQVGAANRGWWWRVSGGKAGVTKVGVQVGVASGSICAAGSSGYSASPLTDPTAANCGYSHTSRERKPIAPTPTRARC